MTIQQTVSRWVLLTNLFWLLIWVIPTASDLRDGGTLHSYEGVNIAVLTLGIVFELMRSKYLRYVNVAIYVLYFCYLVLLAIQKIDVHSLSALMWFGIPYLLTGIINVFLYRELARQPLHT